MEEFAKLIEETRPDGTLLLRLEGTLTIAHIADIDSQLRQISGPVSQIDISAVEHIDTVGAWLIYRTARNHDGTITGAHSDAHRLIEAVSGSDSEPEPAVSQLPPFYRLLNDVGLATVDIFRTFIEFIGFIGQCVKAIFNLILHPRRLRFHSVVQHFDSVGVRALGIVGLMSFLIGIVIAQQGAVQLRQFGAEVWTVNLIGRLTLRELGVLMTAIMVAGRSGSAFAAQIGTMKITEEVDAMRTIGVVPVEALVIPRIIATVIMMPLLGIYASLVAIAGGGLLCWVSLDIPPATFIERIREVTPITDFYVGMVKAPVFGAFIAMAGCFKGMLVHGISEEVGRKTTSAVVQAIFLVIVLDAFFAVFFTEIGWN
jgi:phospholipid/cholesterol/gamma-HCH transport system permease protein